jgi:hypothetical protein
MLVVADSRRMVMTRLRRLAMMRGPLAVRTWERSSPKSRSRIQWSRSSMLLWPRMMAASWGGLAWVTRREVTAQQVSASAARASAGRRLGRPQPRTRRHSGQSRQRLRPGLRFRGHLAVARSIYHHLPAGPAPFWSGTGQVDITHARPGIVIEII